MSESKPHGPGHPPVDLPEVPRVELTPEACALLAYRVMSDDPLTLQQLADLIGVPRARVSHLEERLYHLFWVRADAAFPLERLWEMERIEFGDWLRGALKRMRVSQAQLAEEIGVTRAAVSAWVNGVAQPGALRMKAVEEYLGLRFDGYRPSAEDPDPDELP